MEAIFDPYSHKLVSPAHCRRIFPSKKQRRQILVASQGRVAEMNSKQFDINKLKVASACSIGWENMTGDERQRFCSLCELNVYNISGMTAREVERLVSEREGRLVFVFIGGLTAL